MRRDPELLRMLRDANRKAAEDLENLKLVKPEYSPGVAVLRFELRKSLAKAYKWIAKEAYSRSRQAKQSSARHRRELAQIKKIAEAATSKVASIWHRSGPNKIA